MTDIEILETPPEQIDEATSPSPDQPDREALLALIARAHPETVLEMVHGDTIGEMLASLPQAQAAWQRIAEQVASGTASGSADSLEPAPVPAGGGVRSSDLSPTGYSPLAKIRYGLERA